MHLFVPGCRSNFISAVKKYAIFVRQSRPCAVLQNLDGAFFKKFIKMDGHAIRPVWIYRSAGLPNSIDRDYNSIKKFIFRKKKVK